MADNNSKQIQEAEKIYAETMAKLKELRKAYRQVLTSAKKRVEQEQINKIRKNLA